MAALRRLLGEQDGLPELPPVLLFYVRERPIGLRQLFQLRRCYQAAVHALGREQGIREDPVPAAPFARKHVRGRVQGVRNSLELSDIGRRLAPFPLAHSLRRHKKPFCEGTLRKPPLFPEFPYAFPYLHILIPPTIPALYHIGQP